jgi:hypothetical protein
MKNHSQSVSLYRRLEAERDLWQNETSLKQAFMLGEEESTNERKYHYSHLMSPVFPFLLEHACSCLRRGEGGTSQAWREL